MTYRDTLRSHFGGYRDYPPPYFLWELQEQMRIADDRVLDGVLFIGIVGDRENFVPLGTGFIVAKNDGGYMFQQIVTARHVIDDIKGDKVHLRANLVGGGTETFYSLKSEWKFHPEVKRGHYIDVAVLPARIPPDKFAIKHLDIEKDIITEQATKEQNLGVGEDIFIVGLFTNHFGESKNIPVVRCGTIASMPQEPMNTEFGFVDGYLIEARSLGGLSGSPVFIQPNLWHLSADGKAKLRHGKMWYFLGLMCGHWLVENPEDAVTFPKGSRETANINTGMGIVIPADRIMETIDQPELANRRAEIIEMQKERAKGKFSFDSAQKPRAAAKARDEILATMLATPPQPRKPLAKKRVKSK